MLFVICADGNLVDVMLPALTSKMSLNTSHTDPFVSTASASFMASVLLLVGGSCASAAPGSSFELLGNGCCRVGSESGVYTEIPSLTQMQCGQACLTDPTCVAIETIRDGLASSVCELHTVLPTRSVVFEDCKCWLRLSRAPTLAPTPMTSTSISTTTSENVLSNNSTAITTPAGGWNTVPGIVDTLDPTNGDNRHNLNDHLMISAISGGVIVLVSILFCLIRFVIIHQRQKNRERHQVSPDPAKNAWTPTAAKGVLNVPQQKLVKNCLSYSMRAKGSANLNAPTKLAKYKDESMNSKDARQARYRQYLIEHNLGCGDMAESAAKRRSSGQGPAYWMSSATRYSSQSQLSEAQYAAPPTPQYEDIDGEETETTSHPMTFSLQSPRVPQIPRKPNSLVATIMEEQETAAEQPTPARRTAWIAPPPLWSKTTIDIAPAEPKPVISAPPSNLNDLQDYVEVIPDMKALPISRRPAPPLPASALPTEPSLGLHTGSIPRKDRTPQPPPIPLPKKIAPLIPANSSKPLPGGTTPSLPPPPPPLPPPNPPSRTMSSENREPVPFPRKDVGLPPPPIFLLSNDYEEPVVTEKSIILAGLHEDYEEPVPIPSSERTKLVPASMAVSNGEQFMAELLSKINKKRNEIRESKF